MDRLGDKLLQLISLATSDIVLVSPFIKAHVIEKILAHAQEGTSITCVTRWRLDEIANGVSDLEIWTQLKERPQASLYLRNDLHAKYYRADNQVLVGSANLTGKGLGWGMSTNLEILIPLSIEYPPLSDFEEELMLGAISVDDSLYSMFCEQLENWEAVAPHLITEPIVPEQEVDSHPNIAVDSWLPTLRSPSQLYDAYRGQWDNLTTVSQDAAASDLRMLDIPSGLSVENFNAYVGLSLLQIPIIHRVSEFVQKPQRFGAVRDFLSTQPCADTPDFDPTRAWQTLMRWLLTFNGSQFERNVYRHSEVFSRVKI